MLAWPRHRPLALACLLLGLAGLLGLLLPSLSIAQTELFNSNVVIVGHENACTTGPSGGTDAYACTLARSPDTFGYVSGACYQFVADVANTGTASLNLHSAGAKTITKVVGGVTTVLADNDIRAGQIVKVCYDGTNMQMVSPLGNATAGVTDGDKGDITVSGSGTVWTIDAGVVTYAKMQNVSATDRFLGRDTAGAGVVEEITPAAAKTMLAISCADLTDEGSGCTSTLNAGTAGRVTYYTGTQAVDDSTGLTFDATSILTRVEHITASSASISPLSVHNVITCDATAANRTYTLPTAASSALGQLYRVIKVDSSANTCGFAPATGERLNGVVDGSKTTAVQYEDMAVILVSTATPNWQVTAGVLAPVTVPLGGTGATTLTGLVKGNGTAAMTAVAAPTGAVVGTTDTQTLTGKTLDLASNTVTMTLAQLSTAVSDANIPPDTRSIATTAPLGGGGNLTGDRTLTCTTCTTNAAALTANQLVIGGGAQASAALGSLGTTTTVLHGNAAGAPTFGAVSLTADVTGILPAANGGTSNGFFAVSGPTTSTKTFTFPNANATMLTDNALVTAGQGGTGNAFFQVSGPAASTKTFTFPNATATVLTSNAPVTIAQGGTGTASTLTGLLQGSASAMTAVTSSTVGQVLRVTGADTFAFGAVDLADTDAITGDLPYANLVPATAASRLLGRGSASGAGDWQEVTLGSGLTMTNQVLSVSAGGGNVSNVGTPVDNQLAVWTTATTIEGTTALAYSAGVLDIGVAGTATGKIDVNGTTSGTVTLQPQDAAGTYNFNLPTTAGASGAVLTSAAGGASPMTWTTLAASATTDTTSASNISAGTLAVARGGTGTGSTLTGLVRGSASAMTAAELSGDVTTSGSNAATIAAGAVTYAKMQDVSGASLLLGRGSAGGAGDPQEITLGSGLTMTGTTLSVSAGGGNVSNTGTPVDNQVAVWTAASTIEGTTALTFSGGTLGLGIAGTLGQIALSGNTSGTITMQPQAAAGTYNWNLPTTAGASGQVLTSGAGTTNPMTWTTLAASATTNTTDAGNISAGTLAVARGGTGTGTTLTGLVRGSASAMTAAELSQDVTTSGSNVATLATKFKTGIKSAVLDAPTTADSNKVQWYFPAAVTITRVVCSVGAATSVTIQLDERAEATPNTAGTNVMTSALVCDVTSEATTTFTNATIAARVPLNLQITAVSGTPTSVRVHVEYTID